MNTLVLSLFPGIGLLDMAFEEAGFCVVRGPDLLWGGDVKRFHPPAGHFAGVIGGPPCQAFSALAYLLRAKGIPLKPNLIPEYERIVGEAHPAWFLMENVPQAPTPAVPGYQVASLHLNNRWIGEQQNRERVFSFGTPDGRHLQVEVALFEHPIFEYAVTAGHHGVSALGLNRDRGTRRPQATIDRHTAASKRPLSRLCELQGLPPNFCDPLPFTEHGKRQVIGNGVPLPMGRAIAQAVRAAVADHAREEVNAL